MSPVASLTDPATPSVPGGSILAFEERDSCPDCGASMAADQRYCLACGHRRGDPRPPFLDAVSCMDFADAGGGPGRTLPPPPSRQGSRGRNSNAALIVGVATLILAVGLGFLVGRAAHAGSSSANHGPERITIESGVEPRAPEPRSEPNTESAPTPNHESGHESAESPGGATESKHPSGPESLLEVEEETGRRKTEEQLHAKVPLPKPTAKLGESCTQGTPGCGKSKKFNGVFFGAEE
jgi:hypothetical protein